MIRIYADFNDRAGHDLYWNLHYRGDRLDAVAGSLGLQPGDQVLLYQDEDDFEVQATLSFEDIEVLSGPAWAARPDWSTMVRHQANEATA